MAEEEPLKSLIKTSSTINISFFLRSFLQISVGFDDSGNYPSWKQKTHPTSSYNHVCSLPERKAHKGRRRYSFAPATPINMSPE